MEFDLNHSRRSPPEHRIILAVVIMAISDACRKPGRKKPNPAAMDAHDFLWGRRLETYLHYTHLDADWMRRELTEIMENTSSIARRGNFSDDQRRNFRMNRKFYARMKLNNKPIIFDPEKDVLEEEE